MDIDALVLLDIEGSESFVLSEHAKGLRSAKSMPWEHIAQALADERFFMVNVADSRPLPLREIPLLQAFWAAQEGLVDGTSLTRLLWTVRRFQPELEYDLLQHVGVQLGDLWRERRWRTLLNLIDRLPRWSWYHQALSNDPEHAQILADHLAKREASDEPYSSPLKENTPEVVLLMAVVDAVNALRATTIMANSKAGSSPPEIAPYPRPRSMLDTLSEKAERKARWSAHESLASRLGLRPGATT